MSDTSAQTSAVSAEMAEQGGALLLRQARERAGLHVVALAAMLKVPVQKLEALEAGRFDELPDAIFTRALASSICRALKIDPAPILASLPQPKGVRLVEEGSGINTPFPPPSRRESMGADVSKGGNRVSRPGVVAVVLLALAAVLWFVLPDDGSWDPVSILSPANDGAASTAVPAPAATQLPAAESTAPVVAAPLLADSPQPSLVSQQPLTVPAATLPTAVPVPPVTAASAAAPAAVPVQESEATQQALTMRAKEASWVQVTGASGRVLVQRSLQAGEVVSVGTDLPLSVVVGRADETEVRVRGAVFDLAPYARSNVARFEVR
jgi:cytoskeleton protein RodZ